MEKRVLRLENLAFLLMPILFLMLPIIDPIDRGSISAFVYSDYNVLFYFAFFSSAMMLFVNGCQDDLHTKNKWYSFIQGSLLIVIAFTPYKEWTTIHFIAAGSFFAFSIFEMVFWCSPKQRPLMIFLAMVICFGLIGHFAFKWYPMYWGEMIGFTPILINKLGENTKKFD